MQVKFPVFLPLLFPLNLWSFQVEEASPTFTSKNQSFNHNSLVFPTHGSHTQWNETPRIKASRSACPKTMKIRVDE